jgi:tRNA(Arg) A34 adenosine deaminase TadA
MAGFSFSTPDWLNAVNDTPLVLPDIEDRAHFVIEASRRNVMEDTGVPFAAAVFDMDGRLIALGVNLAIREQCCVLHGEMVALMLAERALGEADFSNGAYELVTSSEPCAMCFGAIPWAGFKRVVCCARASDDRAVAFDEGDKRADWAETYRGRGIDLIIDVCRNDAVAILEAYVTEGTNLHAARRRAGLGM